MSLDIIIPIQERSTPLSCIQRSIPEKLRRSFTPLDAKRIRETFSYFEDAPTQSIQKRDVVQALIKLNDECRDIDVQTIDELRKLEECALVPFEDFCHIVNVAGIFSHHSAYISTTRKVERKYVDPKTMKTFEYEDGSVYTGEASKYDVFEGQGSYDCGAVGEYTGHFSQGRFHGEGHLWYADDAVFEGQFRNGFKDGEGTLRFSDGSTYHGALKMGVFEGYGEYACAPSGSVFKGHFLDGKKSGAGTMRYRDGATFEGTWRDDRRTTDHGKLAWANGDVYEGEFNGAGLYHGQGRLVRERQGDAYEGAFVRGLKEGFGTAVFASGDSYTGEWARGTKSGHGAYTFAKGGHEYEGQWVNDRMEGIGRYRFQSGDTYEGSFLLDQPHGTGEAFYARDGSRYVGEFRAGLPHGTGTIIYNEAATVRPARPAHAAAAQSDRGERSDRGDRGGGEGQAGEGGGNGEKRQWTGQWRKGRRMKAAANVTASLASNDMAGAPHPSENGRGGRCDGAAQLGAVAETAQDDGDVRIFYESADPEAAARASLDRPEVEGPEGDGGEGARSRALGEATAAAAAEAVGKPTGTEQQPDAKAVARSLKKEEVRPEAAAASPKAPGEEADEGGGRASKQGGSTEDGAFRRGRGRG